MSVRKEMATPGSGKLWTGQPTRAKTPRWLVEREIERENHGLQENLMPFKQVSSNREREKRRSIS